MQDGRGAIVCFCTRDSDMDSNLTLSSVIRCSDESVVYSIH